MSETFDTHPGIARRLTETEDDVVSKLFREETEDRVGFIIKHLPDLTLKQKVHVLLLISDEEFRDFRARRRDAAAFVLPGIIKKRKDLTPQEKKDLIEEISQMRDSTPRFEVEAELRRRNPRYSPQWDLDLEEDKRFKPNDGLLRLKNGRRISYEEAIEFTRFENTRLWYRNFVFPQLTRFDSPLPLGISTLVSLLKIYRKESFRPDKPGTDVSMDDLVKVCDYYLDYEADNTENCLVHQEVRKLAGIIKELEDAVEDKK